MGDAQNALFEQQPSMEPESVEGGSLESEPHWKDVPNDFSER